MVPRVTCNFAGHSAKAPAQTDEMPDKPTALDSNLKNRLLASYHKTASAFIEYPARGLRGDINSNFYEFLSMGCIPYLLGSAAFIGVFNAASRYFDARGAKMARKTGLKFAAGVIFYGLAKSLSKSFISRPVAWATGVDIDQPYINVIYPFPKVVKPKGKNPPDGAAPPPLPPSVDSKPIYQYQKLWESREFPRIDLIGRKEFDKIAEKNGLGKNLNDPQTEVKPIIRNIISTATTAQRVSSFLWAACGVCIAACGNWDLYYDNYLSPSKIGRFVPDKEKSFAANSKEYLKHFLKNSGKACRGFGSTFKESAKEFYKGSPGSKGFAKHAGKGLFWLAAGSSILGTANTIIRARNMGKNLCRDNIIIQSKETQEV